MIAFSSARCLSWRFDYSILSLHFIIIYHHLSTHFYFHVIMEKACIDRHALVFCQPNGGFRGFVAERWRQLLDAAHPFGDAAPQLRGEDGPGCTASGELGHISNRWDAGWYRIDQRKNDTRFDIQLWAMSKYSNNLETCKILMYRDIPFGNLCRWTLGSRMWRRFIIWTPPASLAILRWTPGSWNGWLVPKSAPHPVRLFEGYTKIDHKESDFAPGLSTRWGS